MITSGGGGLSLNNLRLYQYLVTVLQKLESRNDSSFLARKRPITDHHGISRNVPPVGLYRPKYMMHKTQTFGKFKKLTEIDETNETNENNEFNPFD